MRNRLVNKLERYARMSPSDVALLDTVVSTRIRRLEPREDLIREGDVPHAVYLILDGWACRYKMLEDGRRQLIAFLLPGDLCDLNIFVLREMDHSVAALAPLTYAEIGKDGLEELSTARPHITRALWWDALVGAAIQREWTVNLGQRTAYERLGHLLCELFLRLEAVGLTSGKRCDFPITQTHLAEATGLSVVHVNRTLQELRSNRLITLQGKELVILDLPGLQKASLFNVGYLHFAREGSHIDASED
jgi:CRP-like cAMP-binding protein